MEQIALDMNRLWASEFPELSQHAPDFGNAGGLVKRMRLGGLILWKHCGESALSEGVQWRSDTARGWAAMAIGVAEDLTLAQRFGLMRPYADDHHFAVREWAWLSLRAHVVSLTAEAIDVLRPWVYEDSLRMRRFAVETTRPRGVWSAHIPRLKSEPWLATELLEPLKADRARYVQDSVANWLNDASKSQPRWVRSVCARWRADAQHEETSRICRRALRSIGEER